MPSPTPPQIRHRPATRHSVGSRRRPVAPRALSPTGHFALPASCGEPRPWKVTSSRHLPSAPAIGRTGRTIAGRRPVGSRAEPAGADERSNFRPHLSEPGVELVVIHPDIQAVVVALAQRATFE